MSTHDAHLPDSIATPEGDAEFAPDQPLTPVPEPVLIPPGSAPEPEPASEKPKGIEKFIDEVVRGEYM